MADTYKVNRIENEHNLINCRKIYSFLRQKREGLILQSIKAIGVIVLPMEKSKVQIRGINALGRHLKLFVPWGVDFLCKFRSDKVKIKHGLLVPSVKCTGT